MPQSTRTVLSATINGVVYSQKATIVSDSLEQASPTVPAAKTGTLTVRTDANTGSLTMTGGHGIITGDKISLFWSGGSRRDVTVGTVATNVVPIDLGSGDDLPTAATAITAMVATSVPMTLDGDEVDSLAVKCQSTVNGWVVFKDVSDAVLASYQLPAGTESKVWASGLDITNPLAGVTVATVEFSHGSTTAQDMIAAIVY